MHKLCKLLLSITAGDISNNIYFQRGRKYLKIFLIKSKCEKLRMVEKTEYGVRSLSQLKCFFRFGGDF